MELQAAILLVVSFALLLMFSVPVSYSIVASAFIPSARGSTDRRTA